MREKVFGKSYSLENSLRESIFREDLFLYNCLQHRKLQLLAAAAAGNSGSPQSLLVNHSKFGADSPHAVKKLLSLSEQGNSIKSGSGRNKSNR